MIFHKIILSLCLVLPMSLNAVAADKPDDAKAIQGLWTPTQAELGGQSFPDSLLKTISLKLVQGAYEVSVAGEPDKGTYTLDPTTTPKNMSVTGTEGPNHGKTFPAIYELDGDTLRICYDLSSAKRPTEFKTLAGTKLYLVAYHRKQE